MVDKRDGRTEHDSAEVMTGLLVGLGLKAELINTGGQCYSAHIELDDRTSLDLNDFSGEWGWGIYHEGESVMSGHWGGSELSDEDIAAKVKALIDAMGTIIR
jgi:hypothetical protein